MKLLKSVLISVIVIFSSVQVFSQVGGISNSKLGSVSVAVIGNKKIEFEPGFYHARSSKYWDDDGDLDNIYSTGDSSRAVTGMNFRFTYGLWDRLEIGVSISTDLAVSSWGARFVAFQNKKIGVAVIAGANIPFGNREIDNKTRFSELLTSVGGGGVFTASLTDNLSIDFVAQYMTFLKKTDNNSKGSWYFNSEMGYYFFKRQLQIIAGLGYQDAVFESFTSQILTVYPGITIETGKNYVIVISAPFDIYGVNALKNAGINFALTLTFN